MNQLTELKAAHTIDIKVVTNSQYKKESNDKGI
jgi:hypothetical protein